MDAMGASPRFLVDGMLIRLGKYLRCIGIDAEWERGTGTRALARRADLEDRILLTRNTRVGTEIEPPRRWRVLASEDPVEGLREVLDAFAIDPGELLFTRCISCNVELVRATPEEVEARVLPEVRARHQLFFSCPSCRTVFWYGSHVVNTCAKLGLAPPAEAE